MPYDISQLLTYSQGIVGDWAQKNPIADWLAPEVSVVTEKFFYKNYGSGNAFLGIDTRRAMGGSSARLSYTVSDALAVLGENSLETTIDDMERRQNPESIGTLEMIKTRDLTLAVLNNDLKALYAFMKANVAVTTGFGNWSNDTVNPIKEIDTQVKLITDTTGVVPNRIFLDLTAWLALKNNKLVVDLIRYVKLGVSTPDTISALLAMPMDIRVGGGALYTDATDTLKNNCFIFYGQDSPGQQDPSFMKTFVRGTNRFTAMREYREDKIRSDVYYLDWQQLRVITGAGIVSRLAIT
jgi:hypothetical protein